MYQLSTKDKSIQRKIKLRRSMLNEGPENQVRIQAKSGPEIGAPDDEYEKEADEVAKQVVSGHGGAGTMHSAKSKVQRKEEEEEKLMAKSENGGLQGTDQLQRQLDSSRGSGQGLDNAVKGEMEQKMGADLSDVKIHTDSHAHNMAEGINAKAFTYGQDIYFKQGNYDIASTEGKSLLAHELAHTQQQKNGLSRKVQRVIDQPGTIRMLQQFLGTRVTGKKSDIPQDVLDSKWKTDESILSDFFKDTADKSYTETKKDFDLLPKDLNTSIQKGLNDVNTIDTSSKNVRAQLSSANTLQAVERILPLIFDIDEANIGYYNQHKKQLTTNGPEAREYSQSNFGFDPKKVAADLTVNRNIADLSGNKRQNKDSNSLEQIAKDIYYDNSKLSQLVPQKYANDPTVLSSQKDLSTHIYSQYYKTPNKQQPFNQAHFTENQAIIKDKVTEAATETKKATGKNAETWLNNLKIRLGNAISLYEDFYQYYFVFNRYDQLYDADKQIATNEADFINNRSGLISGHPSKYLQLIQAVADADDISYRESNILTIHYDERVNSLTTDPASKITGSISEASVTSQKIIVDNRLTGVVLFETGGLKIVKLGVWAFDNLQYMRNTLQQVANMPSSTDPNTGATLKASKLQKVNASEAVAYDRTKINTPGSVKIVQEVVGAPRTGSFDELTVAFIYQWQKKYTKRPKKKEDRGKLRDEDIDAMFKQLITRIAPNPAKPDVTMAKGPFNAVILLVMDYYGLQEAAMLLKEADFQKAGSAKGPTTVQGSDELYMQMYYQEDADPSTTEEAAATYPSSGPLPAYIQIGNSAFSSARDLATTIAHELIHARQDASDDNQSNPAAEMYAYLMETNRKLGNTDLPKSDNLFYYIDRIEIGTRKYYWILPTLDEKISYRTILQQYADAGNNRIADYVKPNYKKVIRRSPRDTSIDMNMQSAIAMNEFRLILQKIISMMNIIEKSISEPVTGDKISAIEQAFNTEFSNAAWGFPSTVDFGDNYQALMTLTLKGVSLSSYVSNFYNINRNGIVTVITTDVINKMTEWVNNNKKDPEKQQLLMSLNALQAVIH